MNIDFQIKDTTHDHDMVIILRMVSCKLRIFYHFKWYLSFRL